MDFWLRTAGTIEFPVSMKAATASMQIEAQSLEPDLRDQNALILRIRGAGGAIRH